MWCSDTTSLEAQESSRTPRFFARYSHPGLGRFAENAMLICQHPDCPGTERFYFFENNFRHNELRLPVVILVSIIGATICVARPEGVSIGFFDVLTFDVNRLAKLSCALD